MQIDNMAINNNIDMTSLEIFVTGVEVRVAFLYCII